jgi:hypothetical protein
MTAPATQPSTRNRDHDWSIRADRFRAKANQVNGPLQLAEPITVLHRFASSQPLPQTAS